MRIGYLTPAGFRRFSDKHENQDSFNIYREIDTFVNPTDLIDRFSIRLDVVETHTHISVTAELPGLEEQDVLISLSDHTLTLTGEKKILRDPKEQKYHLNERSFGPFKRLVHFPFNPNPHNIQAHFKNGLLIITLEKTEEKKPYIIPIKTS